MHDTAEFANLRGTRQHPVNREYPENLRAGHPITTRGRTRNPRDPSGRILGRGMKDPMQNFAQINHRIGFDDDLGQVEVANGFRVFWTDESGG